MQIGGLLGDVIFFAVSGFCLYNIKDGFFKWYKRRVIRIYPKTWIMTTIFLLIGFYTLNNMNIFQYYIFPTYYHFVGSIVFLYILYYIVIKVKILNENLIKVIIGVGILQLLCYIFLYDKSFYHIDVVREPIIRFLFFEAMLIGAMFRKNKEKYMNKNNTVNWIFLFITIVLYFGSKLIFTKMSSLASFQLLNQYILIICLYFVLRCFSGIDAKLERLPAKLKKTVIFLASITLEIYLVQYPIIPRLADKVVFPINWIIITGTILVSATILHYSVDKIIDLISKKGNKNNENINNRSI